MSGFIEGADRSQISLFPERLEDWICEDNPVRIVDVFVDALDLTDLCFVRLEREANRNVEVSYNRSFGHPKTPHTAKPKLKGRPPAKGKS